MIIVMRKTLKKMKITKNFILFTVSLIIFLTGAFIVWASSLKVPDFHSFEDRKVINSTKIYDKTGQTLLYDIHQDVKEPIFHLNEWG